VSIAANVGAIMNWQNSLQLFLFAICYPIQKLSDKFINIKSQPEFVESELDYLRISLEK